MKLILGLMLFISTANAGIISFVGPCSEEPLFSTELKNSEGLSVGTMTIDTLKTYSIPFLGTEQGMNSIFDTPTGLAAMEVISDTEMLAHGWCYSVNGFEPNTYPNEVMLKNGDNILWWFGYAHYKDGQWITQCTPAFQRRSAQFCSN